MGAVEFLGDLSATYLDGIKDWMYNDPAESPRRRSTLAAVDTIVRAMAAVLAPILPFTAEDVWDHLPKRDGDVKSVHLSRWPSVVRPRDAEALNAAAEVVASVRGAVHAEIEPLVQAWGVERQAAKKAGREPGTGDTAFPEAIRIEHPRDAHVRIGLDADSLRTLEPLRDALAELLVLGDADVAEASKLEVAVQRAPTPACDRCWRRRRDVESTGLCARCAEAVRIYDEEHKGSA
jgi:isoleucyl-tRNA synthetase